MAYFLSASVKAGKHYPLSVDAFSLLPFITSGITLCPTRMVHYVTPGKCRPVVLSPGLMWLMYTPVELLSCSKRVPTLEACNIQAILVPKHYKCFGVKSQTGNRLCLLTFFFSWIRSKRSRPVLTLGYTVQVNAKWVDRCSLVWGMSEYLYVGVTWLTYRWKMKSNRNVP